LYALAHEPALPVACTVAISPPRLSYSWFCSNPEGPAFLETYHRADALMQAGQPATLLEVSLPIPFAITAAGYVEKYGPDERYNYLSLLNGVRSPLLITLGALEVADNMAFRAAPEALAEVSRRQRFLSVATIADANHFYTNARAELIAQLDHWFSGLAK
jgi:hypothetical protein